MILRRSASSMAAWRSFLLALVHPDVVQAFENVPPQMTPKPSRQAMQGIFEWSPREQEDID